MTIYDITGALVGLAGACSNNGNTQDSDTAVREALVFQYEFPDAAPDKISRWIQLIHSVKFAISPNCASCAQPCGNTSDLPMDTIASSDSPINTLKKQIIDTLALCSARRGDSFPIEAAYQALLYVQSVDDMDLLNEELNLLKEQLSPSIF